VSQNFFFYSKNRIHGNEAISEYLENFSVEAKEYSVIYRAPKYLSEFTLAGDHLGITATDNLDDFSDVIKRYNFKLRNNEIYLLVPKNKSKDFYFAKSISDRKIEQFQTLIGLYHHKEAPAPIIECLVVVNLLIQCISARILSLASHLENLQNSWMVFRCKEIHFESLIEVLSFMP
jgi:hypothetical protein